MLLDFLQYQRDAVLKIVEGLPEDAWQTPVVPSGWTVAGMLAHLGGVEHHWLQHVTTGVMEEPPAGEEAEARSAAGAARVRRLIRTRSRQGTGWRGQSTTTGSR